MDVFGGGVDIRKVLVRLFRIVIIFWSRVWKMWEFGEFFEWFV